MNNYAILRIRKPDDSGERWECKFQIVDADGKERHSNNKAFEAHHTRTGMDPTTDGIVAQMPYLLGLPPRRNSRYHYGHRFNENRNEADRGQWARTLVFENGMAILIEKEKTRYRVMGKMVNKSTMMRAIAKVMYSASQGAPLPKLFTTLMRHLEIPDNVSYALENRAPYYWFEGGTSHQVSLRVSMISDKMCAIEISDGIWADIKTTDMNSFLNFYRHGKKNSSWKNLSPARLWTKLMGKEPTEGQLKLMKAFLLQNRTKDLVEKRAQELMADLEKQYPDRIKIREKNGKTWMYVRGKIADWALNDTGMKAGLQMVSTYVFANEQSEKPFQHGSLRGAICIDNMTANSTLGDQFATRAIAMMNDVITITRVNTIRRYIPEDEGFVIGQEKHRMNWDEL